MLKSLWNFAIKIQFWFKQINHVKKRVKITIESLVTYEYVEVFLNNVISVNVKIHQNNFPIARQATVQWPSPSLFISPFLHLLAYFYLQLQFLLHTSVYYFYTYKLSSLCYKSVVDTNFCLPIFLPLPPLASSQFNQCRLRAAHPVGDKQKLNRISLLVTDHSCPHLVLWVNKSP